MTDGRNKRGDMQWAILGPCDLSPPPRASARKGHTKYAFGELAAGYVMEVRGRTISAVGDAVRRYVALHPGEQFRTWRGANVTVMVKRVK